MVNVFENDSVWRRLCVAQPSGRVSHFSDKILQGKHLNQPPMCVLSHVNHVRLFEILDCGPPGFSAHGILQAGTRVVCHALLQEIFLTQGLNPGLLHWQAGSLPLAPPGRFLNQLIHD